jgi:threonine dehydrogenase-like Zn-dependent dehydrogenase
MSEHARAVVYRGPENFQLEEYPLPELGPADMIVEVTMCGVDGSELHMYRGTMDWLNERIPVIFGDEIVGRVAAVGSEVAERRSLAVGDRVVVEARWPCGDCPTCTEGQYYLCEKNGILDGYGSVSCAKPPHLWGGYATHVYVPGDALVYRAPDELSDEAAIVGCSALANGLRWTERGGVIAGQHVVVIGPGPQGLACTLAAVEKGARVTVVGLEQDAERLAMADELGAAATVVIRAGDEQGKTVAEIAASGPPDVVIDAAGVRSAKALAVAAVRPTGTIVNAAVPSPQVQEVDWLAYFMGEVTVVAALSHPHKVGEALELARSLLVDKGIDLGDWVTHSFGLDEAATAIATASYQLDARPIKVVLRPQDRS